MKKKDYRPPHIYDPSKVKDFRGKILCECGLPEDSGLHIKSTPPPSQTEEWEDCICTDFDRKGISPCGVPCPIHNASEYNANIALEKLANKYKHGAWLNESLGELRQLISKVREEAIREGKMQGAEDLFVLIDKEFGSFKIDEAMGKILQRYSASLSLPEKEKV